MGITFFEDRRIFKLDTHGSTYMIQLVEEDNYILHMYYGRRLKDYRTADLTCTDFGKSGPSKCERERCSFNDRKPFEYPTHGLGDFREDAFCVQNPDGHTVCSLAYRSHNIFRGKKALTGLPATFGNESECTTLEITAEDSANGLTIVLSYTVFEDLDVITRSVQVTNNGRYDSIKLTRILSTCVELEGDNLDYLVLAGSWAREKGIDRHPIGYGCHNFSSRRGISSAQMHPFMAVLDRNADEDKGNVYGFNFVYSGNFLACIERSQFDSNRVLMGVNPSDFSWNLSAGETFQAPEAVMVFSSEGIGGMTRTFHDLYRNHLIRSPYLNQKRPILINNWEATYFDFNTDKLIAIAKEASKLGIEMLVMDDGWFGKRNWDDNSLGDWTVNEQKLQGGLKHLVDEVNKLGMKFGIWFEPEMISPDSDLFRAHPDWAIQIPGRDPVQARAQLILDLSRPEVVDYTFNQVAAILRSANIEYVKWDMNRPMTDLGSFMLDKDSQGELFHRYVLGVYELQNRLVSEFPYLLLENCSSGGGRFDPGMLYFSPQIWTSDDTDAIERLKIQQGTAMIYPLSAMGAHISDCPNHIVGRVTPFETRGYVALAGTFGYELDVTRIPADDVKLIPAQVAMYHKFNDLVRCGDYYRIASYINEGGPDAWAVVSKDKKEALLTVVNVLNRPNYKAYRAFMKGLDPDRTYRVSTYNLTEQRDNDETSFVAGGDALMYAGFDATDGFRGDFAGRLFHILCID